MNRVLRNLILGAATALGCLGAAELALRVVGWPDPGIYAGDLAGLWTLRPNLTEREVPFTERRTTFRVRTNAAGWRDDPVVADAMLCLGDSTTFGWGVEEAEAWPARLEVRLGAPVINAGVPGYTTHQALQTIDVSLTTNPRKVVLAFLVRDADPAPMADANRPPSRGTPDLQLLRAVRGLRAARASAPSSTVRVPPDVYARNLRALIARTRAAGAEPVLLAFPMLHPPAAHLAILDALSEVAQVFRPTLPASAFFAEDPVHLTPGGNEALAAWLAPRLAIVP